MKRAAFSLIELVLAIVIIAISLMTIPLMLSQSGNNNSFSIAQETIFAARTKIGNILTHQWDANSTEDNDSITYIRVLDVINGDASLDRLALAGTLDDNRRMGHVQNNLRRRFHDDNITVSGVVRPSGGIDEDNTSIDQFNGDFVEFDSFTGFDYVREFNLTTAIFYISDNVNYANQIINFNFDVSTEANITDINNSTNIKMIEVVARSEDGITFTFRTFSSNIGQTDLLSREVSN